MVLHATGTSATGWLLNVARKASMCGWTQWNSLCARPKRSG